MHHPNVVLLWFPVKVRIDKLMVDRGLVPSRERAQALILAGKVLVNEQKVDKAGTSFHDDVAIRLLGEDLRYVSRGGLKLEKALQHWDVNLNGRTCLDVGASTGGFTDCMLQHGAANVIAVDTGYGQIDMKLRQDSRVQLLEKTNARYLTAEHLSPLLRRTDKSTTTAPIQPISFVAMDVSFISATLVLPAVIASSFGAPVSEGTLRQAVVLVKPQFEVGREHVGKGGIVRDLGAQITAAQKVRAAIQQLGATETDLIDSPILGAEGNREFLLFARFGC
ncbi:MAG TPA: TlyA family RNA methyltransferase [Terriglobales bacterium]|nr:TlyA family RNA methyltransferase [Terriglobales bacterium]